MKRFGYVRVSTMKQSIERQIKNIKALYPDAVIVTDEITGTKLDRPGWNKIYKAAKAGDMIVFDSVSRMSRDASEGFQVYQELYQRGVSLVFIKEPLINTDVFRRNSEKQVEMIVNTGHKATDKCVNTIIQAFNDLLMDIAKDQIRLAFEQSQKEVEDLHQRTREGIETARLSGKQIGQKEGAKLDVKKREPIIDLIRKYSKDFDGTLDDVGVMAILKTKKIRYETGKMIFKRDDNGDIVRDENDKPIQVPEVKEVSAKLARGTYYKYKRELKEGI